MIKNKHNNASKEFMQKILLFIDSVLLNTTSTKPEEVNRILVNGILNIRDAVFSEIIRDNQVEDLNNFLQAQEEAKKKEVEDQTGINQDLGLESDQDQ